MNVNTLHQTGDSNDDFIFSHLNKCKKIIKRYFLIFLPQVPYIQ